MTTTWSYPYKPTDRQLVAHEWDVQELLYGGAAGGGKTEWLLAEVLEPVLRWGVDGLILRRTFPQLSQPGGIVERLLDRIPPWLGTYNRSDHRWTFRNGALLQLGYLQSDDHVQRYVGGEYGVIGWDQLEQFTEWQYRRLWHPLRVGANHPATAAGYRPRMLATANPGGVGHTWVKGRFIDPAPAGKPFRPPPSADEPTRGWRLFVPALPTDNPHLDPGYMDRLRRLPPDERRALLGGDWDVYAGQRFSGWRRDVHVIDPEEYPIPLGATVRAVGVDYGMDAPFSAHWGARGPDGTVVVYRELYQAGLTPRQQAEAILDAEAPGERTVGRPVPVHLDPSTWARSPGQPQAQGTGQLPPPGSIASDYVAAGLSPVLRANNDRLAGVALVADKLQVRGDGRPRLLVYSTCANLIRTLPALPRDSRRPEDVDTSAEDHAYDSLRYLLMGMEQGPSRPEPARRPRDPGNRTLTGDLAHQRF